MNEKYKKAEDFSYGLERKFLDHKIILIVFSVLVIFGIIFLIANFLPKKQAEPIITEQPAVENKPIEQEPVAQVSTSTEIFEDLEIKALNDLYKKAVDGEDSAECEKIQDEYTRNNCFKVLAAKLVDEKLCNNIANKDEKINCQNNFLLEFAKKNNDLAYCGKIAEQNLQLFCFDSVINKDTQVADCEKIDSKVDQTKPVISREIDAKGLCRSKILYFQGVEKNDLDLCKQIPDGRLRMRCLSIVSKIPLDSDVDGDGLTYAEEINYNTDPNKPDTDGDGFPDGQEIKGGYMPIKNPYFR